MSAYVYVIGPAGGPYKIGIACDISRRIGQLQISSPVKLALHASVRVVDLIAARVVERRAHSLFAKQRLRGEWFDIDAASAGAAIERCSVGHRWTPREMGKSNRPRAAGANEREIDRILQHNRLADSEALHAQLMRGRSFI